MLGATDSGQRLVGSILLLVSDPLVRAVMQETLEREGYSVLPAGTLGAALDLLKQCTPDLLITRTYVEGMPGHDAASICEINACTCAS
jgi:CheY-like chemotaxis protein